MGGLHSLPVSCFAWGNPVLESTGSMVWLLATSKRIYTWLLLPVPLSTWWAIADPQLCRRSSDTHRYVWLTVLWGHCSFPLGLDAHRFVCASQEWSLCFPQSYGGPVIKFHLPSKSDSLGILSTFADPQAGESDVGLRIFTMVRELLWYCSPVCGSPDKYRIWFYHDCAPFTILLEFLHCPWMWVIFSWWVPVSFCLWLFDS